MLVTCLNKDQIKESKARLAREFDSKDLGLASKQDSRDANSSRQKR